MSHGREGPTLLTACDISDDLERRVIDVVTALATELGTLPEHGTASLDGTRARSGARRDRARVERAGDGPGRQSNRRRGRSVMASSSAVRRSMSNALGPAAPSHPQDTSRRSRTAFSTSM
jgi:hypothetical protein